MRKGRRSGTRLLSIVAIIGVLVLASCGGGEPTATPAATPTAMPQATSTQVPSVPTQPPTATARPVPTATSTSIPPTPTAEPKYGGRLTLRLIRPLPPLDSYSAAALIVHYAIMPILNNLIMLEPYELDRIVGDLAESFEVSADGLTHTFNLRQGIKWQDGKEFTSADVIYNYERAKNPPGPRVAYHSKNFEQVDVLEAPDDYTVRVVLKEPSARFLPSIAISPLLMYPAHISMEDWNTNPVGTGPYVFRDHVTNVSFHVDRNPSYWKEGLPYLDGLDFQVIADAALAEGAFRSGQIVSTNNGYDGDWFTFKVDDLKRLFPDLEVRSYVANRQDMYFAQKEPWTNDKVRQAIHLAFNRFEFVPLFRRGFPELGEPLASWMVPAKFGGKFALTRQEMERLPGFRVDDKAEDIAAAKRLLDEAGVDLSKINVQIIGGRFFQDSAEAAQGVLRESLGLESELQIMQSVTELLIQGSFDININSSTFLVDDPVDSIGQFYATGGGRNFQKWANPEIDAMLDEQDRLLDYTRRLSVVENIQRQMFEWAPGVPMAWTVIRWGYRGFVKDVPGVLNVGSPFFRWEQVWLDR